jgi:hypothetical protein
MQTLELNQRVSTKNTVTPIDGVVRGIWITHAGKQYEVQYMGKEGRVHRDWFVADELIVMEEPQRK